MAGIGLPLLWPIKRATSSLLTPTKIRSIISLVGTHEKVNRYRNVTARYPPYG